jgi:hypothetical protein
MRVDPEGSRCETAIPSPTRAALYLTKLHERLLAPALDSLEPPLREALVSAHELDYALARLDADLTARPRSAASRSPHENLKQKFTIFTVQNA